LVLGGEELGSLVGGALHVEAVQPFEDNLGAIGVKAR
jgi:hypothetical protein